MRDRIPPGTKRRSERRREDSILCLSCGSPLKRVIDVRWSRGAIRRRRPCDNCGARFTTWERIEGDGQERPASLRKPLLAALDERIDEVFG